MRPKTLSSIIGQTKAVDCLKILVDSAKTRNSSIGHTIITGQCGLGKTTLAIAAANDMGVECCVLNAATLTKPKHIIKPLVNVKENDILFIDEFHRIPLSLQEILYTAIEDYRIDIIIEDDIQESLDLSKFCLMVATNCRGMLSKPMLDRMQNNIQLEPYTKEEIAVILAKNAEELQIDCSSDFFIKLAERSRGVPRVAINLLTWVRDYSLSNNLNYINIDVLEKSMKLIGVDDLGLNNDDRTYLKFLESNGISGLKTIESGTGLDLNSIENCIEPYLFSMNLIKKTGKGRMLIN